MIYTGYTQTDAYFEFTGSEGKLIMPATDVVLVDDESGMIAIKNTASRCTVGLLKKGSTPPTPPAFQGKWKATYSGGTTASASCDATSAILQNEVSTTNLVELEIGPCVTWLDSGAFTYCSGLTSLTIPESITGIGAYTFAGGTNLASIIVEPLTPPLIGTNAFIDSTCPIYVPNVDTYKNARGWDSYTSRLQEKE